MTPERQRIVIAELCGFTDIYCYVDEVDGSVDELSGDASGYRLPILDYLNDRDAIYPVLEQIPDEDWDDFADILEDVTHKPDLRRRPHQRRKDIFTASCGELCEAFLRYKGKWEETTP